MAFGQARSVEISERVAGEALNAIIFEEVADSLAGCRYSI